MNNSTPILQVRFLEQPANIQVRRSKEGLIPSIDGIHSVKNRKTFPVVEIRGWKYYVKVEVFCATKEEPHYPHPFQLIGEKCNKGVYTEFMPQGGKNKSIILSNVGIQTRKEKYVEDVNENCKASNQSEDFSALRLCVNVYIKKRKTDPFGTTLASVVSDPILITDESSVKCIPEFYNCSFPAPLSSENKEKELISAFKNTHLDDSSDTDTE